MIELHPLQRWRHVNRWSRPKLARAAGTTGTSIYRIENDLQRPRWDLLARLVDVTKLSADHFLRARHQAEETDDIRH
jgi:transcriptional regulator with XRE-family HTH domain